MQRREMLKILGATAAVPLIPKQASAAVRLAESLHRRLDAERAAHSVALRVLSPEQDELVTTMAEMIIPETDTPGATAAHVNEFVDLLLAEWSDERDRDRFLAGLDAIDHDSRANYGRRFVELGAAERELALRALDGARDSSDGAGRAFGELKRLTVYGYFTSELVQKNVLKTNIWPGRFDGCVTVGPPGSSTGLGRDAQR
jgi:glucoside 3-dehydrogenase (cytochrome c) hitch-hiker subunit